MVTYRYTYNRRVAKAPGPMELYFADKVLPRLVQKIKQIIPTRNKLYKFEVFDHPGERSIWITLPGGESYIAVEAGYGVTDEGLAQVNTEQGREADIKLTGNVATDVSNLEDEVQKLHDKYEEREMWRAERRA